MENIPPHMQRVHTERAELDIKCEKLAAFIEGARFKDLDPREQTMLVRQWAYMEAYSDILTARIDFNAWASAPKNGMSTHDIPDIVAGAFQISRADAYALIAACLRERDSDQEQTK